MNETDPVLKQALGPGWNSLAPVIQAHYGLTPFTDEQIHLKGIMDRVSYSPVATLLMPIAVFVGALVPYRGQDVPVQAINQSIPDKPEYFWTRTFHFPGKKPYTFHSAMICTGDGQLTEYVRFGLGIRLAVTVRNGGLIERDLGYVWKIGRWSLPLPIHLLFGRSYIEEMPISDNEYQMKWKVTHPLFGEMFAYSGRFAIVSRPVNR
ncbi:MAG TPA: DUF4166 domain-containing protein [Anaerolineales bacterium]|nr:DUF4166 domain-containing protein [Anaerolineales bacterium]